MAYKRLKDNYTEEEYNQCVSAVTNYMNNAKKSASVCCPGNDRDCKGRR
mgnify:CR=1 FL=1